MFPKLNPLIFLHRRTFAVSAAALRPQPILWTSAPLINLLPASDSLSHIVVDISTSPDLALSYTTPGQYLQLRLLDPNSRPSFFAIASPPSVAASKGIFEFLVKPVPGSTAERLCNLRKGDVVELSPVMGRGFQIHQIYPPDEYPTVLIFATGSAISPIRSLIEAGFGADKRSDVRLYYGARNLRRMAYQERFRDWESSGIHIVPVLSKPDVSWTGERGYVQAAYGRGKRISSPQSTSAVLCGQRQMAEAVTSVLVSHGVSKDKILKNF